MEETIFEPYQSYQKQYKELFRQNASDYFDHLVSSAQVNVEENKANKKQYDATSKKASRVQKDIHKLKVWRGVVILLIILFFFAAAINICWGIHETYWKNWIHYLVAGLSVALLIGGIVLIVTCINKKLKKKQEVYQKLKEKIDSLYQLGMQQMSALNQSFDWNMHIDLVQKTIPLIHLDPFFSEQSFQRLNRLYEYSNPIDQNQMITNLMTGNILENPFLIRRVKTQTIGNKTYHGSLVITWTTTSTDSKGHTTVHHHTQTLHASVTKPAPFYNENTSLLYLNEAAPDLSFSRSPSPIAQLDEKKRDRKIRKKYRDLKEKAASKFDVKNRKTLMTNDDFEVLFGATDRDHDVQFRLLFTPLAQQNELDLIQSTNPYGDDFRFIKKGKANYIISKHAQAFSFQIPPSQFVSYSVELSKEAFMSLHCQLFESLYFDLAPLLSIPLYQQQRGTKEEEKYDTASIYEIETLLKSIPLTSVAHEDTITDTILKMNRAQNQSSIDKFDVTAYSFKGIAHTDFIPVWGGDGRTHAVPVEWIEYIPVERTTCAAVIPLHVSRQKFQSFVDSEEGHDIMDKLADYFVYQKNLLLLHFHEDQDPSTYADLICLLTKRLQNV